MILAAKELPVASSEDAMFTICGRTQDDQGDVAVTAIPHCAFEERKDAESFLNRLTQLLRPDAGYEGEQDCWWVRNNGIVTRYTIQV
jgi:hypothetical protein